MTATPMRDQRHAGAAELDTELHRLRDLANQGEDVCDQLLQLSDRAIHSSAPDELTMRAFMVTLWCLNYQRRSAVAQSFLSRAMTELRSRGVPGCGALSELLRGEIFTASGDHKAGLTALVGAATAVDFAVLAAAQRVRVLGMLAVNCLMVDPGDTLTACLHAASAAWPAADGPMPIDTAAWLALPPFFQWLWSGPAFQARLPSVPPWPRERRDQTLRGLQAQLAGLAARPGPRAPMTERWLDVYLRLVTARLNGDREAVVAALPRPGPGAGGNNDLEMSYAVAGTLLDMGQAQTAQALIGDLLANAESVTRWEVRLNLMHLRSAIAAQAEGSKTPGALGLYAQYAAEAARQMLHMNFDGQRMLKCVTQMPGAQPADHPLIRPRYLERALLLMSEQPLGHKLSEVAAQVGVSGRTLREAFGIHVGMGPKEYSTFIRLKAAHAHISAGLAARQTLAELAQQFGFTHPGRFAFLYRKHFGHSPREGAQPK
jgi:AraC-like DNA-binding protein